MQDHSGQSFGRYHILKQIGEGGMAVVYLAEDTTLHRKVAVKMIRTSEIPPSQLSRLMERFKREAEALARLSDDPAIVTVYDYGEYESTPYLVMAYMPKGSLKEHLKGPLDYRLAARLLVPVTEALAEAHSLGIIHRDVKPSNLLINRKGTLALADFGIAKALELDGQTLTSTGMGVGTPEYMAPEQWKGESTAQSDVYALGVVFYEMVTGHKPYAGVTPSDIFLKQMTEAPVRPRQLVPSLPDGVEALLVKALVREPQKRFASMLELRDALDQLAAPTRVAVNSTRQPEHSKGSNLPVLDTREETRDLLANFDDETRQAGGYPEAAIQNRSSGMGNSRRTPSTTPLPTPSATVDELDMQTTRDDRQGKGALADGKDKSGARGSSGIWIGIVAAVVGTVLIGLLAIYVFGLIPVGGAPQPTSASQAVSTQAIAQAQVASPSPASTVTRTAQQSSGSSNSQILATKRPAPEATMEENITTSVYGNRAILRIGPGENYRMLCYLDVGMDLNIIGRNSDGSWLLVELVSGQSCYTLNTSGKKVALTLPSSQQVWVSNASLKISGGVSGVMFVNSPPTETPIVVKEPAQSDDSDLDDDDQYP